MPIAPMKWAWASEFCLYLGLSMETQSWSYMDNGSCCGFMHAVPMPCLASNATKNDFCSANELQEESWNWRKAQRKIMPPFFNLSQYRKNLKAPECLTYHIIHGNVTNPWSRHRITDNVILCMELNMNLSLWKESYTRKWVWLYSCY